jgi:signal transduction histidine kinase
MRAPLGSVRSRITVVTTLVVAGALTLAAVLLLGLSRSTLVDDVRKTLTQDLLAAREQLNRGVITELSLLELGQAVDPVEVSTELANLECAPPLGEAYGTVPRSLSEFYQREGISPLIAAEYEDCIEQTNPYTESVARCEISTIKSLGDPVLTFEEAQELLSSAEFEAEVEACLDDSLRVDIRIEAAASLCDPRLEGVFADIDVLNRAALELRYQEVLDTYAACMRGNGVADYPDLALGSNEEGRSVLSGLAGSAIVLPSLETVRAGVDTFRIAILVGVPVLVLDVGMVAWFAVGRALRPVEAIRRRVTEIRAGSLDRRVPEPASDDEIGRLARTMNEMLERLERSSERQRQFVSDASHELRSPIASMRTQLEVAAAYPAGADWPDLVSGVLDETERMERLVDDLLALARADEGVIVRRIEEVDLGEIVLSETERIERLEVVTEGVEPVLVRGDGLAVRRVVRNLLENAARHAASAIEVRVAAKDGGVAFEVDDDGSGIAPADRNRVFERFTRLEEGRSRDAGGTGLGLAVVREIVAAHGGSVAVLDGRRGGARFAVWLPAHR